MFLDSHIIFQLSHFLLILENVCVPPYLPILEKSLLPKLLYAAHAVEEEFLLFKKV